MNEVGKKRRKRVHKVNEDQRNLQQQWKDLQEQLKLIEEQKYAIITERQKLDAQKQQVAAAQYKNLRSVTQEATPVVVKSVSNIGNLCEFTLNDDWILWMEKFECYLLVNEVAEEKKVPLFMTLLNMEAYALLRNLCAPSLPHTKSLRDLKKVMTDYLKSTPSVITARCRFKECRQKEGEEIKKFVANLRALSLHCGFGATLENELRDQFVSGVKCDILKKKFLEEPNLTFRRATELAMATQPATPYVAQPKSAKELIIETNINSSGQSRDGESPRSDIVVSLIYWREPMNSISAFSAILCVLHSMAYLNLLSMVVNTSLLILGGSVVFRIFEFVFQAVRVTSVGNPLKDIFDEYPSLTAEEVHEFADVAVANLNAAVAELRKFFLVEDFMETLKFGMLLWFLSLLGSWFNGMTLISFGVVALFTLPKVYERNKAQIDQLLA